MNIELTEEEVTLTSGHGDFTAFWSHPSENACRGGIIVIHEIFGLTDHIREVSRRLALEGYDVIAPNLFSREGKPPSIEDGFGRLREFARAVADSQIMADLQSCGRYLRDIPTSNGKAGAVGFCWGGRISMLLNAAYPALNAAVVYYGAIVGAPVPNQPYHPLDVAATMHAPLLGHFGEEDSSITPSMVAELRESLKQNNKTAELYVYEHAGHAFNNDTRESYRPEAADLAFKRTLSWFARYLSN